MKRINIVGLCLVAAFAFSAVAATSALALPEFVMKAGSVLPIKFAGTDAKASKLLTKNSVVECTADSSAGEVTGPMTFAKVVIKFTGCKSSGFECESSKAKKGEIVTNSLKGELGETAVNSKVGVTLEPETSGGLLAKFTCFIVTAEVSGSVIGEIPTASLNKSLASFNLVYAANAAMEQEIQEIKLLSETKKALHLSAFGEAATQVAEGKIELLPAGETGEIN